MANLLPLGYTLRHSGRFTVLELPQRAAVSVLDLVASHENAYGNREDGFAAAHVRSFSTTLVCFICATESLGCKATFDVSAGSQSLTAASRSKSRMTANSRWCVERLMGTPG